MFRTHINNVTADNPCVTREFSMFRTDINNVSPAFSIFRSHINNVIDRIASVSPAFRIFKDERILVDDRRSIVPPQSNVAIGERRNGVAIDRLHGFDPPKSPLVRGTLRKRMNFYQSCTSKHSGPPFQGG
jgi:hypothetical protein